MTTTIERKKKRKNHTTEHNVERQQRKKKWFRWNTDDVHDDYDVDGYLNWPHDDFHLVSCYTWWEFEHNFCSRSEKSNSASNVESKTEKKLCIFSNSFSSVLSRFGTAKKLSCWNTRERERESENWEKAIKSSFCRVSRLFFGSNCWRLRKKFFGEIKSDSKWSPVAWVWSNTFYSHLISYLP